MPLSSTDFTFDQGGIVNPPRRSSVAASLMRGDEGNERVMAFPGLGATPFKEGWGVQDVQPPRPRVIERRASIMPRDEWFQAKLAIPFAEGWKIELFQPPVLSRRASQVAAATLRGDDGSEFILIPPWLMASPRSTFPNYQANVAAAIPSYNAGPQVGAIFSMPNIVTPTLLKASPGTLFAIVVVAAGSQAGAFYDCNSIAAASSLTQVSPIPTTGGPLFLFEWPCQYGIVVIPGAGQVLAAKWA